MAIILSDYATFLKVSKAASKDMKFFWYRYLFLPIKCEVLCAGRMNNVAIMLYLLYHKPG